MTLQELTDILANPENSKIEFNREGERPERIAKEIVAFANFRGGHLIFGVDDATREIVGITNERFEQWLMDTVFGRYVKPFIIPIYQEIMTEKGRVAVVSIEQGVLKPYMVQEGDRQTPYIRIGSTSRIADRDQILRMAQESGNYHFEIAPVSGSTPEDIDVERFHVFYEKEFGERLVQLFLDDRDAFYQKMLQLDLLIKNNFNGLSCSIAGLILFGTNPGRFLPQYGFRIIHFKGQEIETDVYFDQSFSTALASVKQGRTTVINGLVDSVMQKLSDIFSEEKILDGVTRERVWKIPERALRELVVNAIIHRDYTKNGKNEIRIFSDRIEIESQGRLPNTLTIEKIKSGQKYPRNPILKEFALYLGLMEHKGLGIRKIVMEELRKGQFPEPEFTENDDAFMVTIRLI